MEYNYKWNEVRLIAVLQKHIIKEIEQMEIKRKISNIYMKFVN